jgi:hypothetical protein
LTPLLDGPRFLGRPGGAGKIAKYGDVGSVSSDAASVDGQTHALRQIEIDSRVVEFREAETGGGQNPIGVRRIDRARRAAPIPGPLGKLKELLPVSLCPPCVFLPQYGKLAKLQML